jgi:CMP-N,N'-diacetyllegionaminic acid synthase
MWAGKLVRALAPPSRTAFVGAHAVVALASGILPERKAVPDYGFARPLDVGRNQGNHGVCPYRPALIMWGGCALAEASRAVALIPARSGSKRVTHKNIRPLAGHPVIAYTVAAAVQSGVFEAVILSTDSNVYGEVGAHYGAEVPFLRPEEYAGEKSPDIEWVEYTLKRLREEGRDFDCFSILRPTSPFRLPSTIRRAWDQFRSAEGIDSLRAVEKCKQHPGKMWVIRGGRMLPLLPLGPEDQPWHSSQYPSLPEVYVQNASLEIAWSRVIFETRTIAGVTLIPFVTEGYEGFDVNQPYDWRLAEELVATNQATLPEITQSPCFPELPLNPL